MLAIRNLTKEYRSGGGALAVLRNVSFDIAAGETVAIVGPSGSGKTTLLGLLAGLDTPTTGAVLLAGTDLATLDEDARARLRGEWVGFVFQSFQLVPTLTALENVQVPLELRGVRDSDARATDLLERVGLGNRTHHFPTQLSGGEQQRVAIARALANDPSLILADEPTASLDGALGRQVMELFRKVAHERHAGVLVVTHDPRTLDVFDRILDVEDGAIRVRDKTATKP